MKNMKGGHDEGRHWTAPQPKCKPVL